MILSTKVSSGSWPENRIRGSDVCQRTFDTNSMKTKKMLLKIVWNIHYSFNGILRISLCSRYRAFDPNFAKTRNRNHAINFRGIQLKKRKSNPFRIILSKSKVLIKRLHKLLEMTPFLKHQLSYHYISKNVQHSVECFAQIYWLTFRKSKSVNQFQ